MTDLKNGAKKVFTALSALGNPAALFDVLSGNYDTELKHLAYFKQYGNYITDPTQLEDADIIWAVENLKNFFRNKLQQAIDAEERLLLRKKEKETATRREKNAKNLHSAPTSGTISELAIKYGLSKSAIRKMRAEGTLDNFIKSKEAQDDD